MRHEVAEVKNIQTLSDACEALTGRDSGVPGVGLVWGATGYGKTTSTAWLAVGFDAVFVRAQAIWTPHAMLAEIMRVLGADPLPRAASMLSWITSQLSETGRMLMIDEADYLCQKRLLETIRDIHDISSVPVLLIGMADFKRKVVHQPQLAGRVSQWVEFGPADLDDCQLLAETNCEVQVAEDLIAELHRQTGGSMRGMTVGLSRVEAAAKRAKLEAIDLATWGNKPFVLPSGGAAKAA